MIGSPSKKLAKMAPENMLHMHETQQANGWRLENGKLPRLSEFINRNVSQ